MLKGRNRGCLQLGWGYLSILFDYDKYVLKQKSRKEQKLTLYHLPAKGFVILYNRSYDSIVYLAICHLTKAGCMQFFWKNY